MSTLAHDVVHDGAFVVVVHGADGMPCLDSQSGEEGFRFSRIFGNDQVCFLQGFDQPRRVVFQVPDGSRSNDDHRESSPATAKNPKEDRVFVNPAASASGRSHTIPRQT